MDEANRAALSTASSITAPWNQNTKLRNLRLTTSWKTVFVYILNPIIGAGLAWVMLWTYVNYTRYMVENYTALFYVHFIAVLLYWFFIVALAHESADRIRHKLLQAGYVQRVSSLAQLDLGLNIALLLALLCQLIWRTDTSDVSTIFMRHLYVPTMFVAFWLLLCLVSLGPIIWFTVRAA